MTQAIQEFFKNIFGNNVVLATILISMLPIIELRGGIPFGMSKTFWGQHALSSWKSLWFSFLGSSLVVPILALVLMPILNWLKKTKLFKKLAIKFENSIKAKSKKIEEKNNTNKAQLSNNVANEENQLQNENTFDTNGHQSNTENIVAESDISINENKKAKIVYDKKFFAKLLGVMLFVAIPLPLTGVWTGTAIAVMLGIPFVWICVSVILGNLIAGIIMQTICSIFPNFTTWILIIFLLLTVLLVIVGFIKNKIAKNKQKNNT